MQMFYMNEYASYLATYIHYQYFQKHPYEFVFLFHPQNFLENKYFTHVFGCTSNFYTTVYISFMLGEPTLFPEICLSN